MENIFHPTNGFILVKSTDGKAHSTQLLDIAQDLDQKPNQGEVVAVGGSMIHASGEYIESQVKVGDLIVHRTYGCEPFLYQGVEHLIVPFEAVRGILK